MIDLYSVFTGNGQKVHIMLEECGLPYTPHLVDLYAGAHRTPEFRKLNPFARVPVIVDRDAPGGPLAVSETAAILTYLAEKSGQLIPTDVRGRSEVLQWLSFISANITPLFRGIFMFNVRLPEKNPAATAYYIDEAKKAYATVDEVFAQRPFLAGDSYSIADISMYTVAATSAGSLPDGIAPYANLRRWMAGIAARPAVQRGMKLFAPS